ncbi:MAG: hypothetical protein KME55_24525 [Nostoc indistinguendum CM1-VF10]|jgi:hypothetical protein|nr:hypothetical protein [Nostoc indistinguendum CM1-VF10]
MEPSDYADEQYGYFQQLAELLKIFNTQCVAKMADLELLRGDVYIYLQSPCKAIAVAYFYKSDGEYAIA